MLLSLRVGLKVVIRNLVFELTQVGRYSYDSIINQLLSNFLYYALFAKYLMLR